MPRPDGVPPGDFAGNPGSRSDAVIHARSGTTIQRSFATADLPRLRESGARDGSAVTARFRFSSFESRLAIDGELEGVAMLTCQRCMQAVAVPLQESFKVLVVQDEAELMQEPGGYEPVLADPTRLDLQVLAEDQALLALPLVPMHASDECSVVVVGATASVTIAKNEGVAQTPFGNLRNLLGKS